MKKIVMYSSRYCGFCFRAKQLLDSKKVPYEEVNVDGNPKLRQQMAQEAGRTSVPQIWIGEQHVGGCNELYELERQGTLDQLISAD